MVWHQPVIKHVKLILKSVQCVYFLAQVIGIIKRNWRPYCGVLSKSSKPQARRDGDNSILDCKINDLGNRLSTCTISVV